MAVLPVQGTIFCLFFVFLISAVNSFPRKDELMFETKDDTALVESTVRLARAAPKHIDDLLKPGVKDAYLYVYGDKKKEDGDLHGYIKRTDDKGADGYKHFDTFHKKDGDRYGYESHSEYGKGNKKGYDSSGGGKKKSKKGHHGEESQNRYKIADESGDDKHKHAAEGEFGYYDEGDSAGFYNQGGDGESAYDEGDGESHSSSYHSEKKTGDGDGEGKEYHESDNGSYESSYESDEADGEKAASEEDEE